MATPHRPLRITRKYLENLYDALYKEGQRLLDKFKPCSIKPSGKFKRRSIGYYPEQRKSRAKWELMICDGKSEPSFCCCGGCKHLGKKGCRVKSLGCKLTLCDKMGVVHPELGQALTRLYDIASTHRLINIRGSKRRTLGTAFHTLDLYKEGTYTRRGIWENV